MPTLLIRRTARLREAGPQGIGRGNRLLRRALAALGFGSGVYGDDTYGSV